MNFYEVIGRGNSRRESCAIACDQKSLLSSDQDTCINTRVIRLLRHNNILCFDQNQSLLFKILEANKEKKMKLFTVSVLLVATLASVAISEACLTETNARAHIERWLNFFPNLRNEYGRGNNGQNQQGQNGFNQNGQNGQYGQQQGNQGNQGQGGNGANPAQGGNGANPAQGGNGGNPAQGGNGANLQT